MEAASQQDETGKIVRDLRQGLAMSHAQVAQEMSDRGCPGIYAQTIVKIEQGARGLKLVEGVALADVFGLEAADLLGGRDFDTEQVISRHVRRMTDASRRLQEAAEDLRSTYLRLAEFVAETPELPRHARWYLTSSIGHQGPSATLKRAGVLLDDLTDLDAVAGERGL